MQAVGLIVLSDANITINQGLFHAPLQIFYELCIALCISLLCFID